jgi:hypothetical protein
VDNSLSILKAPVTTSPLESISCLPDNKSDVEPSLVKEGRSIPPASAIHWLY